MTVMVREYEMLLDEGSTPSVSKSINHNDLHAVVSIPSKRGSVSTSGNPRQRS